MIPDTAIRTRQIKQAAMQHAHAGRVVIPLQGKVPYKGITTNWQKKTETTLSEIGTWPDGCNYGIVMGRNSEIAIDFDGKAGYVAYLEHFPEDANTLIHETGSRKGYHLIFKVDTYPANIEAKNIEQLDGANIEVKSTGRQIVGPLSIHPDTGLPYRVHRANTPQHLNDEQLQARLDWIQSLKPHPSPDTVELTEQQRRIIAHNNKAQLAKDDKLKRRAEACAQKTLENCSELRSVPEGSRNDTLYKKSFKLGMMVAANMTDYSSAFNALVAASTLPNKEARVTAKSGLNDGLNIPYDLSRFNDDTNRTDTPKQGKTSDLNAVPEDAFSPCYTPPDIEADVRIHEQYISNASDKIPMQGVQVIISDKGTGKSFFAKPLVQSARKRGKVWALAPYISLTKAAAANYDLEDYDGLDDNQRLQTSNLAICLKSTGNFAEMQNKPKLELLVLDELSKMLEQLKSKKIFPGGSATDTYAMLEYLIKNAKQILVLDADIDGNEIEWLKSIRQDVTVIVNEYAKQNGRMVAHETRNDLQDHFINSLADDRNGRPIYFCSNTASKIEELYDYLNSKYDYKLLSIHSGNSNNDEQKEFLKAPDKMLKEQGYDALLFSPSVLTGVDIQTPFYRKFGDFAFSPSDTPAASGCSQLLERARHADETHIWVQQVNGSQCENADDIYRDRLKSAKENEMFTLGVIFDENLHMRLDGVQHRILDLQSKLEARDNASRNRLYENFLNLSARNYEIVFCAEAEAGHHTEGLIETANEIKAQEKEYTLTLNPIDDKTFNKIEARGAMTRQVRAQHERWKIEGFYNRPIDESLYEFDSGGKGRSHVRQYAEVFLTDRNELEELDDNEVYNNVPISHRSNRAMKQVTIHSFMKAVWGSRDIYFENIPIEKTIITERAQKWLDNPRNADRAKRYFNCRHDHKTDAWNFAKRMIRTMGLRFKRVGARDKEAEKRYQVDTERRDYVDSLAKSYRKGIEAKRKAIHVINFGENAA